MSIRGRDGKTISDHWEDGPTSYLGITAAGFPNLFMVLGPNGPFSNIPPAIEIVVEFITGLIGAAEARGVTSIESTAEAEDNWTATCREYADYTLFPKVKSWFFGTNIPGKQPTSLFYMGGLGGYRNALRDVADKNYEGFTLR